MNINENDLGDRMATGISYGTSGIVNPGVSTYSSPDVSQHPIDFYPVGQNKIDSYNSMRATGPDQKDIDSVKNKVTPDEVLCGLEYELKRMFYKNKSHAKQMVVDNLKKDPKYYSKLHMLNINDEFIKENTSIEDDIVDLELLLKNPDVAKQIAINAIKYHISTFSSFSFWNLVFENISSIANSEFDRPKSLFVADKRKWQLEK